MNIQNKLKNAMVRLGVNQRQLANMSGVDQSVISRAIRGKRSITVSTLEKLWPYIADDQAQQEAGGE